MVKVGITDEAGARAWLETQPHQVQIWFAARWALRVAPVLFSDSNAATDNLILMSLRALLTASVSATCSASEFDKLEEAARAAQRTASGSVMKSAVAAAEVSHPILHPNHSDTLFLDDYMHSDQHSAALITAEAASTIANPLKSADTIMQSTCGLYHLTSPVLPAAVFDMGTPGEWQPLWPSKPMSEKFLSIWSQMKRAMQTAPEKWAFWLEWYEGFLRGIPLDWELQRRIALLPDEVWDAGPEVVAERIVAIWESFESDPPLPEHSLQTQARILLAKAISSETAARGLQSLIQMALDAYRREISNALPEALEALDNLPGLLNSIATVLAGESAETEKERQLVELLGTMAQVIETLNFRLATAHSALAAANAEREGQTPRRLFADAFYARAGEGAAGLITSKLLWGGVISGGALLLGADADALTEGLGRCFQTILAPEAQQAPPINPAGLWTPSTKV